MLCVSFFSFVLYLCSFYVFLLFYCYSLFSMYFLFWSFFFFKQKTAYEMRISDWSSDVCSSDLLAAGGVDVVAARASHRRDHAGAVEQLLEAADGFLVRTLETRARERVERDQVDLGRVLHLHPALEVAHQPQQPARVFGLVVHALHQGVFEGDRKSTRLNSS